MVLLRDTVLVMDFLSNEEQDAVGSDAVVSFHALNKHVMIRHNDSVQARFNGSPRDVLVCSTPIRVAGMHV
jgi:hypothetical protein